jgi:thymidylate synthase
MYETQSEAWASIVRRIISKGVYVEPRGLPAVELVEPLHFVVAGPCDGFVEAEGRKFRHTITAVEGLSLVGQIGVPEMILDRVGAFAPYANDGIFWGAYGTRIAGDLGNVVSLLKRDSYSRQAVLTIFDSDRDLGRPDVRDVPCTVAIQFKLRSALDMWVMMRSQDAWLGLPYDLGQFSLLQMAVAQAVEADVGLYHHSVGAMHLYKKDIDSALQIRDPISTPRGMRFGADDIEGIASRCRRLLLGEVLHGQTSLEDWLAAELGS